MKKCGKYEQPGALEFVHETMAERVFVGEVFPHETANITNDLKNVLVYSEHMKEIVLHLADHLPEGRNISTQNIELVHQTQCM